MYRFVGKLLVLMTGFQFLCAQSVMERRPEVGAALQFLREAESETIREQISISEIPAPPFKEERRAAYLKKRFAELGLENARLDGEGNVLAGYPGGTEGPLLVLSAHLDSVFPEGTDVRVRREGNILKGPGISDDSRGLAVMLAVARALTRHKITLGGRLLFVGTVGEEGLGNLRGVRHLFNEELRDVDYFISIDDVGLKTISTAVGSHRYRVIFRGSGGHSYADFGIRNPMHALGRAMAGIAAFQVPDTPKTTFSIGRVAGGTSVNAIAHTVWMEVDMRSRDAGELDRLDRAFRETVASALRRENRRWSSGDSLTMEIKTIGRRPTGRLAEGAALLRAAARADSALGIATAYMAGSTDANVPISMGIEALTLGGGGEGEYKHSLRETFDATDSHLGTQRILLTVLELLGVR